MSLQKKQHEAAASQTSLQLPDFFENHFEDLQQVIETICARHKVFHQEAEEFKSYIHFRLVDKNYAIIRAYDGRSSFQTYLYTVISRLFIDKLRTTKGRWRPSKKAQKQGEVAIKFEELVHKERYTAEAAYQILTINHNLQLSRQEWKKLVSLLAPASKIQFESQNSDQHYTADSNPESALTEAVQRATIEKLKSMLEGLMEKLEEEDHLILKMKFFSGHSIIQISRVLGKNRNFVSKRLQILLIQIKNEILSQGFTWECVREVFEL